MAEREEAEEEEEIQSSRGHCPYSDSPLLLHAPLLMKDIALSVGEVEREGGGSILDGLKREECKEEAGREGDLANEKSAGEIRCM